MNRNIVNIVVGALCQGYFRNSYHWKSLWTYRTLWTYFHGNACIKQFISQDYLANLKMYGGNTCSIYNMKSYGINGKMHMNKYWKRYLYFIIHTIVGFWTWQCPKKQNHISEHGMFPSIYVCMRQWGAWKLRPYFPLPKLHVLIQNVAHPAFIWHYPNLEAMTLDFECYYG